MARGQTYFIPATTLRRLTQRNVMMQAGNGPAYPNNDAPSRSSDDEVL